MSQEFVKVASTSEVPTGSLKAVDIGQDQIVIANVNGKYYAIGRECNHAQWDLSEGELEGDSITCAGHGAMWNLKTGEGSFPMPLKSEPVYDVKVDGSDILLKKRE